MLAKKHLAYSIVTDSIESGLDRKCLTDLEKRFLHLNQQRLSRIHSALNHQQQHFLSLLPLLFHVNHPMMPGYVGHSTPAGICEYTPQKDDLQRGKNTARSFRYHQPRPQQQLSLEGIFLMGSLGTVAHSRKSDLDIWLCHRSGIDDDSLLLLEKKCQKITAAAKEKNLECHFFLMDAKNFEQGLGKGLSDEASGSTQHYLLLDEFYRTAVWLAGRLPLWWFVPSEREQNYQDYRHNLLKKRYLAEKKVLDFGPVATIPAGEFIGAALWQLYKAIESPYKSVFKLMLLESYTHANAGFQALALHFKQQIYQGAIDVDELDPYIVAYRRIEQHLLKNNEFERLELARRCLYFKVNKPLSKAPFRGRKSWQRELLEKLVDEWQWDDKKIAELDKHRQWKAGKVISERKALVNELVLSYGKLQTYKKQHQANANIDRDEFSILGHKLFANYERRPGKIDWINPDISDDLSEENLCFVEDGFVEDGFVEDGFVEDNLAGDKLQKNSATLKSSWRVYASSKMELESNSNWQTVCPLPLKHGSLMEVILWCHCNGLLIESSRCDFVGTTSGSTNSNNVTASSAQFHGLVRAIQQWLPLPLRSVEHDCFKSTAQATQILIHINLGREPYQSQGQKGLYQISDIDDALGYGELKDNLVKSIDMVCKNNWNEVVCHRFDNDSASQIEDNALVACLRTCLQAYLQQDCGAGLPRTLPDIRVNCASSAYGNTIRHRVGKLIHDILNCYRNSNRNISQRYIFSMEKGFYACQCHFEKKNGYQLRIEALTDKDELEGFLSRSQSLLSPIVFDRYTQVDDALRLVAKVSHERAINIVYHSVGTTAKLTVLDEQGSLYRGQVPYHNDSGLLRSLHYFLRNVIQRQVQLGGDFNADFDVFPVKFYRLQTNADNASYLDPINVTSDMPKLNCYNIQVAIKTLSFGNEQLSINCNGKQFHQQEYDTRFMSEVLEHIVSLRQAQHNRGERYPCYITDIDLSQYRIPGLRADQWQSSHYLRFKFELESRLNAEL